MSLSCLENQCNDMANHSHMEESAICTQVNSVCCVIFVFAAFSWVHDGDHGEVREGRGDILGGRRWAQFRPLTSTSWVRYYKYCKNDLTTNIWVFAELTIGPVTHNHLISCTRDISRFFSYLS